MFKGTLIKLFFAICLVIVLAACNDNAGDNNNNNDNGNNDNISSMSTDQSSNDYPETQPIKTQDAKYDFRTTPRQGQNANQNGENVPNADNTGNNNQQQAPQQQQQAPQQTENHGLSQFESDVVTLTNKERRQAGLSALQIDTKLSQVAREKSNDMQRNNYFSHTSPTYGSPFDMMRDNGITYRSAGENIAQGQTSPAEVVQAWMNSQGHRENILNANFTHIGVGYESQGQHWTQMFITK
ncbi:CAP domain-containing protein [Paucisalibacillus globulus]|uniref:CAP domain-containing protein n=1 Tax=Paucisalibacillus globulus TaxID=351095 RepID=UPI000BB88D13|nr:CAP domain-containing protein [Paucisalibacillus globulus]